MRGLLLLVFLLSGCVEQCVGRCGYDRDTCMEQAYGDVHFKHACLDGYEFCV